MKSVLPESRPVVFCVSAMWAFPSERWALGSSFPKPAITSNSRFGCLSVSDLSAA